MYQINTDERQHSLAEGAAAELDLSEELDDPLSPIWELALLYLETEHDSCHPE